MFTSDGLIYKNLMAYNADGVIMQYVRIQADHAEMFSENNHDGLTIVELTDEQYLEHWQKHGKERYENGQFVLVAQS